MEPMVPSADRVQAAVHLVVERLGPDQVVLFGSAARGEMRSDSDLDLLVIGAERSGQDLWRCSRTRDRLHLVMLDRSAAERHRLSASYVQGPALEEGRTVYLRPGASPVRTGHNYVWDGDAMVRTSKYEPDHAATLLDAAEGQWEDANQTRRLSSKCRYLQETIEYSLKALLIAAGRRVHHIHELGELWTQAEAASGPIDAVRDPRELTKLTLYAGRYRYDGPADDPAVTWETNRSVGEAVLRHARHWVPPLVEQTTREVAAQRGRLVDGQPPSPPATPPDPAEGAADRASSSGRDPVDR